MMINIIFVKFSEVNPINEYFINILLIIQIFRRTQINPKAITKKFYLTFDSNFLATKLLSVGERVSTQLRFWLLETTNPIEF